MKLIFTFLIVIIYGSWVFVNSESGNLTVKVTNLRNNKGSVIVSVFNSADGFPMEGENSVKYGTTNVQKNTAEITFTGLPPGDYAVAVLHDEDNDKEVDTNFLGIPKEGVAASNNATGTFGPPKFEDARFSLGENDVIQVIKMEYF